jgi:hypothetical protein
MKLNKMFVYFFEVKLLPFYDVKLQEKENQHSPTNRKRGTPTYTV